jgi:hypothetical protein
MPVPTAGGSVSTVSDPKDSSSTAGPSTVSHGSVATGWAFGVQFPPEPPPDDVVSSY